MRNINWKFVVFWPLLFLVCTPPTEGRQVSKPVAIAVTPKTCEAPCKIEVLMTLTPHPENYRLVLMWSDVYEPYGRGLGGTHAFKLDHESPSEFSYVIKDVPKGGYYLAAFVYRGNKGTPFAESDGWVYVGMEPPK